jgi:prepilin-type processing-associated H-X9-DG protein
VIAAEPEAIVPPSPLSRAAPWGTYQAFSHFRHTGLTSMVFLDGHVEALPPVSVPPDPTWGAAFNAAVQQYKVGFPSAATYPYTGN